METLAPAGSLMGQLALIGSGNVNILIVLLPVHSYANWTVIFVSKRNDLKLEMHSRRRCSEWPKILF